MRKAILFVTSTAVFFWASAIAGQTPGPADGSRSQQTQSRKRDGTGLKSEQNKAQSGQQAQAGQQARKRQRDTNTQNDGRSASGKFAKNGPGDGTGDGAQTRERRGSMNGSGAGIGGSDDALFGQSRSMGSAGTRGRTGGGRGGRR